jgi:hypothetical protein
MECEELLMYYTETYLSELKETLVHERAYLWKREAEIDAERAAAKAAPPITESADPASSE